MAAQCNFSLVWNLISEVCLGKPGNPCATATCWKEQRQRPLSASSDLGSTASTGHQKQKYQRRCHCLNLQANTHMECFCYQLCPTCANVIEHQVQIPQAGVSLGNKQSRKQWELFFKNPAVFSKKEIHIQNSSLCSISGSSWVGE